MPAVDAIRSLRARMPWSVARRLLKSQGLERAQGWDRMVTRVADGDDRYDQKEQVLRDALEEHIMCGEKIAQLFSLEEADITTLRQSALTLQVPDSEFRSVYPFLLPESELINFRGSHPVLVDVVSFSDGVAVVLASTRFLTTRETVSLGDLPNETAAQLSDYNELIGIRHRYYEALDVLWIPTAGTHVELRVDLPFGSHQHHGASALTQAVACFDSLLGSNLECSKINLYPVMQSLYNVQGDGSMVELAFMVTGSAQKHEKTRRGEQCCREETYHLGGIQALAAPIQVYVTSVLWHVDLGEDVSSEPEVTIRGVSTQTAEQSPFIGEMTLRNCVGFHDYNHARDRILAHLTAIQDVEV